MDPLNPFAFTPTNDSVSKSTNTSRDQAPSVPKLQVLSYGTRLFNGRASPLHSPFSSQRRLKDTLERLMATSPVAGTPSDSANCPAGLCSDDELIVNKLPRPEQILPLTWDRMNFDLFSKKPSSLPLLETLAPTMLPRGLLSPSSLRRPGPSRQRVLIPARRRTALSMSTSRRWLSTRNPRAAMTYRRGAAGLPRPER